MGEKQDRKKVLKIISRIDVSAFDMPDFAIQVRASSLGELLEDAAKADEAIIYSDNDELARLHGRVLETPTYQKCRRRSVRSYSTSWGWGIRVKARQR
jgi:hypothetical protein